MKKLIFAVGLMGIIGGLAYSANPPTTPVVTYSYQITNGQAQIITTTTLPNGAKDVRYSPPMGKAQLTMQLNQLANQQTAGAGQLSALNSAVTDSELTQP